MTEKDLELLITLDEPWDGHEDIFNHLKTENTEARIAQADVETRAAREKDTGEIVEPISQSLAKSSAVWH